MPSRRSADTIRTMKSAIGHIPLAPCTAAVFAAAMPFLMVGTLSAQTSLRPVPAPLTPVHQGVSDIGPLSTSFLVQSPDLRVATDFDKVYRVPGSDKHLMRIDGALAAVFPESEYISTREGIYAVIPAGTVWTIGVPTAPANPKKSTAQNAPNNSPNINIGIRSSGSDQDDLSPRFALTPAANRGQPVDLAISERLTDLLPPQSATVTAHQAPVNTSSEKAAAPDKGRPTSFDLSSEFYRQLRLREITERYRPRAD